MPQKPLSAQASSTINNNRDKNLAQIEAVNLELANWTKEETFWSKKSNYSQSIIDKCESIINMEGFHPIQKTKARVMKFKESMHKKASDRTLSLVQLRMKSLQIKLLWLQQKDQQIARRNENTGMFGTKSVAGAEVKIRDGQIDFSSKQGKKFTENLFDPKTGEPTANFETLKQMLVDYPKSITTLPDSVIQELANAKVKVRAKQATTEVNGQTQDLYSEREVSGFDYMKGMAAAGFQIAEQQGRTMQANPESKVDFANWVKDKQNMINASKSQSNQNQNANQTEATF